MSWEIVRILLQTLVFPQKLLLFRQQPCVFVLDRICVDGHRSSVAARGGTRWRSAVTPPLAFTAA